MSDLSKPSEEAPLAPGSWLAVKRDASRLQDWFVIQSVAVQLAVLAMAVLIPATGNYSFTLIQKQAAVAEQVKTMAVAGKADERVWMLNESFPWCLAPARCWASWKPTRSSASRCSINH